MKVGIIGPGAMGLLYAYFFNKAGIDIVLLGKNAQSIADIKNGVNITIDDKTETFQVDISDNPDIIKYCDIIFLFVKSYDTETVINNIITNISNDSIIITLQNGIGNKDVIAKYIPESRIVYGSTSFGATRLKSDTVRLGGMGINILGGADKKSVNSVGNIMKQAGLDVSVTDNPESVVWKKAIINAGINPLGALLGIPNGAIIENEFSKDLQEQIVRESVKAASVAGQRFVEDEMIKQIQDVCRKTGKNLCSMLQDVIAKRKTEIDNINGKIIEYGKKGSVQMPYNQSVYWLIKAKEKNY